MKVTPSALMAMVARKSLTAAGALIIGVWLGLSYPSELQGIFKEPLVGLVFVLASTFLSYKNITPKAGDSDSSTPS